jgi:hypothetical protein
MTTTLSQDSEARLTRRDGGAGPSAANPAAFGKVSRGSEALPFHENGDSGCRLVQSERREGATTPLL